MKNSRDDVFPWNPLPRQRLRQRQRSKVEKLKYLTDETNIFFYLPKESKLFWFTTDLPTKREREVGTPERCSWIAMLTWWMERGTRAKLGGKAFNKCRKGKLHYKTSLLSEIKLQQNGESCFQINYGPQSTDPVPTSSLHNASLVTTVTKSRGTTWQDWLAQRNWVSRAFAPEKKTKKKHSPVWVLISKNVLDVSTVIVANVPSVICALESLLPLDLVHSSDCDDCLRKFRHLRERKGREKINPNFNQPRDEKLDTLKG